MEINGKVYRNLEGQVEYLTGKWDDLQNQINDVRSHLTHYVIVDTLPTEDIDTSAVYLLGPMGTAPDTYYEEWVYVQLADESWTWEKLGDTDSVDLSGYLAKKTGTTTYRQAYCKEPNGTQSMVNVSGDPNASSLCQRNSYGQLNVASPTSNNNAVNKYYADSTYLAKQTGTTTRSQLYGKHADGSQIMFDITDDNIASTVAKRTSDNQINTSLTPVNNNHATSKYYVDNNFLAKQTGVTTNRQAYIKAADGSQTVDNVSSGIVNGAIVARTAYGYINVPETPVDNTHAASKKYVDDAVGQLLYLHDIELVITVDASNKLYVKAYLVSSSATAITSFDRQLYRRIDVQWGAFGPNMANVEAVAVSKLPDTFRQDEFDEPFVGFLYQYISGGNLISGKTNRSMSTTITDTVISF